MYFLWFPMAKNIILWGLYRGLTNYGRYQVFCGCWFLRVLLGPCITVAPNTSNVILIAAILTSNAVNIIVIMIIAIVIETYDGY